MKHTSNQIADKKELAIKIGGCIVIAAMFVYFCLFDHGTFQMIFK